MACLPYFLPLIEGLVFGRDLYNQYESFNVLLYVFGPILQVYHGNSFTPFLVFFALFLLVVRNSRLPHFVRFNAMQSMLLDICLMLAGLIISYLPTEISLSAIGSVMCTFTFLTSFGSTVYALFFTLLGKYADIPTISEAVYIQTPA